MLHRTFIANRIALLAAFLAAFPAFGSVLGTYEDRSTWNGLTTGIVTDDFESLGLAVGGYTYYGTGAGLTRGSVNYFGVDGGSYAMLAINPTPGAENNFGSGIVLRTADYNSFTTQYMQITLPDVTAVGFDLGSAFPNAVGIRIQLSTGEFYIRTTQNAPTLSFWGVQSDAPISWIRISLTTGAGAAPSQFSSIALVDNVSYGSVYSPPPPPDGGDGGDPGGSETPEVTTFLYVASGIGLLFLRRKSVPSIG
ncbi:MAG: hypothetical protein ABI972_25220 [Acidobacteriota bacterium]